VICHNAFHQNVDFSYHLRQVLYNDLGVFSVGGLRHVLTRFSGFYAIAVKIAKKSITDDAVTTLEFFRRQLDTYGKIPVIRCQLVFVLQSIKDYHIPAEYIFKKIDKPTRDSLQNKYTILIDTGTSPHLTETHPRICNFLPVDPQSNSDSSSWWTLRCQCSTR
jgi:hypothetical protein